MNEFKNIIKNWVDNNVLIWWDKLRQSSNLENGLIEETDKQIKKAKHYVYGLLGSTNSRPVKKDGDFTSFLPTGEQQNAGFERMWCISENGICNQIETDFNYYIHLVNNEQADEDTQDLVKIFRHFGLIVGDKCLLETAYVASGSGTTRRGNLYSKAGYFVRKNGLVPKGSYPAYSTWNGLYYPKNSTWINGNKVPTNLLDIGRRVAEYIDFTYEWVRPEHYEKTAPMGSQGSSCYAWQYPDKNGIYQRVNYQRNHSILRFKKNEEKYKPIADSYNPFIKKLALNYNLGSGFLISYGIKKKFNIFQEEEIKNFQKQRGVDYLLLVETYNDFKPGLYKIDDGMLEKIELPKAVDEWIKGLAKAGKLIGINSKDFSRFIT